MNRVNPYIANYVFQSIVNESDHTVHHVEMLTRIAGQKSADDHICLYEKKGWIVPYDISTLLRAICLVNEGSENDGQNQVIAVNMSAKTLERPWAVSIIDNIITEVLNKPDNIIIEITETCKINNISRVSAFLKELRSFGIRLSIDDFGDGFHKLEYIKHLKPDFVKINANYIRNNEICSPYINIAAKDLHRQREEHNFSLVAENIESEELKRIACDQGFNYLQGYYISAPAFYPYRNTCQVNEVELFA